MTNQQANELRVAPKGQREIVSERVFVDKMDPRPGGDWRFVTDGPDGSNAFRGTFRAIEPPERIEQTFEWEGMPGHVVVETATFEDLGDRTKVTTTSLFHTTEERDGMLGSGMEGGMNETFQRLDELLAKQG